MVFVLVRVKPFDGVELLGVGQSAAVEPEILVETDGVNHQRVAFPPSDGMAVIVRRSDCPDARDRP